MNAKTLMDGRARTAAASCIEQIIVIPVSAILVV